MVSMQPIVEEIAAQHMFHAREVGQLFNKCRQLRQLLGACVSRHTAVAGDQAAVATGRGIKVGTRSAAALLVLVHLRPCICCTVQ